MGKKNRNRQPQAAQQQATDWPVDGNGAPVVADSTPPTVDTEPGEPEPEPIQPGDRVRVHGDRNVMDPEVMDATVTAVWGDGCVDVKEGWRVFSKVPPQGSVPEGRRCFVRL